MSDCLSPFIFPRLTIYRAVHLTSCYLSCCAGTFRKCLPTFRMVAITSNSRPISLWSVHITTAEIRRLPAVRASNLSPPPLSLPLTHLHTTCSILGLFRRLANRMFSQKLYCSQWPVAVPHTEASVLYDANSVSFRSHKSSARRKCD